MHIVYVTGDFVMSEKEVLTGMPRYIYKIAAYMKKQGNDVVILAIGDEKRWWVYEDINVYSIPIHSPRNIPLRWGNMYLRPVMREVAFNRALDEIHANNPISLVQYAGWYGVGMLYSRKYPSILRISTYTKLQLYTLHKDFELKLYAFYERIAARNFNGIISPSKALGEPYSKEIGRKVVIIETPYEMEDIEEDDSIYFSLLSEKKYFLFFGRISPDKGIGTIARGINQILTLYPDYYFCFAGQIATVNGVNYMKLLKSSAGNCKDRVVYLGNLAHAQLNPIIRNAECVVLPSLMDNLPNAGLEAMALNGIVIGSKGASFDEMFEDCKSGYLIEKDNEKDLIDKIGIVVEMNEEQKEFIKINARNKLKKYRYTRVGHKLENYYKYIVENSMQE